MGIKSNWARWAKDGIKWPFMHDPVNGKPSITVLFSYVTFVLTVISVIALHFYPQTLTATGVTMGFWGMATVFYMLRKISKAKFNADERSFELEGETSPDDDSSTPKSDDNVGN